jgi:hypothetical protein
MAFDGTELESVEPFTVVRAFVESLLAAPWWSGGPVRVTAARRDASSSTTRTSTPRDSAARSPAYGAVAEIRLAATQCTRATAVHELAHVLAGPAVGHGAVFRRGHVDLAVAAFGVERGGWLAEAYAAAGLELGERAWLPPRAEGPGHVIAL